MGHFMLFTRRSAVLLLGLHPALPLCTGLFYYFRVDGRYHVGKLADPLLLLQGLGIHQALPKTALRETDQGEHISREVSPSAFAEEQEIHECRGASDVCRVSLRVQRGRLGEGTAVWTLLPQRLH